MEMNTTMVTDSKACSVTDTHPKTAIAVKKGRVQVKQIDMHICDKK